MFIRIIINVRCYDIWKSCMQAIVNTTVYHLSHHYNQDLALTIKQDAKKEASVTTFTHSSAEIHWHGENVSGRTAGSFIVKEPEELNQMTTIHNNLPTTSKLITCRVNNNFLLCLVALTRQCKHNHIKMILLFQVF